MLKTNMDWENARQYCLNLGLTLAIISNKKENDYMRCHILNISDDPHGDRFWVAGHKVDGKFEWWNNIPMDYANWLPTQPDNSKGIENCMEMRELSTGKFGFNDAPCSFQHMPICCDPESWGVHAPLVKVGDKFYHFSNLKMNWENAKQYCLNLGLTLAIISSKKENNYMRCHILNISDDPHSDRFWIAGHRVDGNFEWWDNIPLDYANWIPTQPDNAQACDGKLWGVHATLVKLGDKCYHFSNLKMNWENAKQYCLNLGLTLAIISSKKENDHMRCHILNISDDPHNDRFWVAGHRVDGKFEWWDNIPLVYTNWIPTQPDNYHDSVDEQVSFMSATA
ncbi:macrophage mannose receptor 1-like [Ctenocephalides felis]|uniref:macrophage mannose receptor 1-like n=1 Tax=Ctenocephalides felis TaxID=7515 RepID=UPI000E6E2988|nr:macrophage mannose receptor 1-like [Ctenocephalides felis]